MSVSPGSCHAVTNSSMTLKLAFDRVVIEDITKLPIIHWEIGSRFFRQKNAEDYVGVSVEVVAEVMHMFNAAYYSS